MEIASTVYCSCTLSSSMLGNFYDFTACDLYFTFSAKDTCRLHGGKNIWDASLRRWKAILGIIRCRISKEKRNVKLFPFSSLNVSKIGLCFLQGFGSAFAQARKHRNINFRWMRTTICGLCPSALDNRVSFMTRNHCRPSVKPNTKLRPTWVSFFIFLQLCSATPAKDESKAHMQSGLSR